MITKQLMRKISLVLLSLSLIIACLALPMSMANYRIIPLQMLKQMLLC